MTKREMYEAIINGNINEEVIEMAKHEIFKMDERNAKRRETPSKKAVANAEVIAQISKVLTGEPQTAKEIAEKVEISTQKASALLRQIDGLKVSEIKVKGKGKVKGYALA